MKPDSAENLALFDTGATPAKPEPPAAPTAAKSSLTPAMRQYLEQKAEVGDALLLFRMGDFYETFYDDAKTISRVLGLTLTTRNKNSDDPIPLAGVPYHALDTYLARLVRAGYKVAISEQVEDPRLAKGLVKRSVDRVITPGTLVDETLLDEHRDNYLAALCPTVAGDWSRPVGLACVELASGRFFAQVLPAEALVDELARLRPAELLTPESPIDRPEPLLEQLRDMLQAAVSPRPTHVFDPHMAQRTLFGHFGVTSMAGFGFDVFDASLCAAAALLDYLKETQRTALTHILKIVPRQTEDHVLVDQVALRSLEVERTMREGSREGSLLGAIDMTVNPMGSRRLREWLCFPLCDVTEIRARQKAVTELRDQPDALHRIRDLLREMGDIERIAARVGVGRASPRDLVGLGRALERCAQVSAAIQGLGNFGLRILNCGLENAPNADGAATSSNSQSSIRNPQSPDLLSRLAAACEGHEALSRFLASALKEDAPPVTRDGGFIADGYNAELDRLRNIGHEGSRWLAEYQAREAQRTGIGTLKVGYNSVFGYYIEITHQHREKVPPDYVRKQTVRNAERYITDELKRHENEVLGAADRAVQLELELFEEIRRQAAAELPRLQAAAEAVAALDVLAAFAELSRRRDYCRPEIVGEATANCGLPIVACGLEADVASAPRGRRKAGESPTSWPAVTTEPNSSPSLSEKSPNAGGAATSPNPQYSPPNPKSSQTRSAPAFVLDIVDGRHPVLDITLAERFVPNDCRLASDGDRLLVITGPNMAGKSTYIRQVALLVLLAQTGSYVPAKAMRLSPVDRIFARVGASDELARGHSTFMVEMVETARILNNATPRSLVILDEIGRGTSTYDGLALAWAITEFIAGRLGARTLFATHYHELTELADQLPGVANYNVAVHEELRPDGAGRDVVFLHKILPGATDRSYGVHVAAMAGLPASVVKRGEKVLAELEQRFARQSRDQALAAKERKDAAQMLLFPDAAPMPDWWRELVDALGAVDIDRTTPLDALGLLRKLQGILREKS